ncbi:MAG TPA: disulfide bond formation protein B [Azospirillaceae bacterium]|nr:disulfide bond formation protein B [Azospirillaceae bacterium]
MSYIQGMRPTDLLSSPRLAGLLLGGLAALALAAALLSQYVGGLAPCELCLWQRWALVAVMVAVVPALITPPRGTTGRLGAIAVAVAGLAFLAGAGIAIFHVGVEQHWWQGLSSCGGGGSSARTAEEMLAEIMNAPVTRCDEVAWSFAGISMAGYNALFSLALGLTGLAAARAAFRRF